MHKYLLNRKITKDVWKVLLFLFTLQQKPNHNDWILLKDCSGIACCDDYDAGTWSSKESYTMRACANGESTALAGYGDKSMINN